MMQLRSHHSCLIHRIKSSAVTRTLFMRDQYLASAQCGHRTENNHEHSVLRPASRVLPRSAQASQDNLSFKSHFADSLS